MAEPSRVSDQNITEELGFRSRAWQLSYRSSSITKGEEPDDILHDFYIPALKLAVKYDRVAGYFRSSSLAAASQGFTSFVGRKGRMRLIVGADLDPEDVRAILAGDRERLERRLSERLESPEAWPDDVRRGVTLLAWMVAQGFLEVRIALRKHAVTGEPIPFDSDEDGYFHEKWFIMTDAAGNRLYGSGSLNESKTALKHNFENITLLWDWLSDDIAAEIDRVQRGFEAMWNNEMPHLAVLTLPEAVRKRLIRLAEGVEVPAEIDGTRPKLPSPAVPSALERLRFAVLRDAPRMPGGRLVGLTTAPVDAWPHQEVVVRRLVE
ncbi:MAG: helicase, partial [Bacillota bacterium]